MTEFEALDFLSSAALRLAELPPEADIFDFVAEQIAAIAPEAALVVTANFDETSNTALLRSYVGAPEARGTLMALYAREGLNPWALAFQIDEPKRRLIEEGKLQLLPGGLNDLTAPSWSPEFAREIETELGVRAVYAQPFARGGGFVGAAIILCRRPSLVHARLVEAFTRLAAVAIQRRRAEDRLRHSERGFRMLAENAHDVIYRLQLKPTKTLEYVSPACTRVTGYTPDELYADPDRGGFCVLGCEDGHHEKMHEMPEPIVVRCRRKDGTTIWTEQKVTPIRDPFGEIVAIEGTVSDINKRKLAEDALLEADRRKTQFLAILSHELRNPLAPIRSALYVLARADPAGERAGRAREVVERQVANLARLIDDLLDVTRITRGKITLKRERLDLTRLLRCSVEDHRDMFTKAGIAIELRDASEPVWVDGDETRISQTVGNLLANAVKFTPTGGSTQVSVEKDASRAEAVIRVRDTGVGLGPEDLPHVFEPFMQAEQALDRAKGGLGIGLMLVKGLVEMHGGSVAVDSPGLGKGTEFTIRLPLAAVAGAGLRADTRPCGASRRVLVIEDNVDAANVLRDALEVDRHQVEVAYDGPNGLTKAHSFHPDVVLCDIGLPGMDGYAVARAMRAAPDLRSVPLVALTGYGSAEDIARSHEAGFDRHIAKPPSIEAIEGVVAELAGAART